jgi:hypothetical protein
MINTKEIYLVTQNLDTGEFEVSTLHLWIRSDQNFYLRPRKNQKLSWIILAAYDSRSEARDHLARLEKQSVA